MTRSGVKMRRRRNKAKVMLTNTMRTTEADLDMTVATVFWAAGKVGIGLGVGVVGGGPIQNGHLISILD